MKKLSLTILIALLPLQVWPQDDLRAEQTDRVRAAVQGFAQKTRVSLLTRGLVGIKGKVIRAREDSFDIKIGKITNAVLYANVLEMNGGGASISFAPDRSARNHGMWEDVGRIYGGTRIFVALTDGRSVTGFSNSVSQTHLIMIDDDGRERVDVPREQIAAVYGLVGGYGGVKKGASKASEGLHTGGRDKLPGLVFTGVAALVGLVKSDGRPILIYSR